MKAILWSPIARPVVMRPSTGTQALRRLAASLRCVHRPCLGMASQFRALSAGPPMGSEERQWSTPLAKELARAMKMTGPVPLASYMRMCLTGDLGGYYTGAIKQGRDQFGVTGDFVTSPEISQMFGELVAIWLVAQWMEQGQPTTGIELIEVGPGRGTLMDDMLRTISNFPSMVDAIDAVYMVEASSELRVAQKNLLCGEDASMTESKAGWHSTSKHRGLPIVWTQTIESIPHGTDKMPLIVAHEFFDALPIHAFQAVNVPPSQTPSSSPPSPTSPKSQNTSQHSLEWREFVVSPTPPGSTHASLGTPESQSHETPVPDFQLGLSSSATRHSLYLPESSPRYTELKRVPDAVIEICPDAALYASNFAVRIGGSPQHPKTKPSGAALIFDYGPSDGTVPANSLRGIKGHQRVSPFSEPGLTDLSADVDFEAIVQAALQASQGVEVHGPLGQGAFLEKMGIRERAEALALRWRVIVGGEEGERKAKDVEMAWERLVDRGPGGMGWVYSALAIVPVGDGKKRPFGFGGDLGA